MIEFRTERVSERVTRIFGVCCFELMYLVEGTKKAALIDTGSGFGALRAAVGRMTDKPLIVLLTHGHTDHAMGAAEFDKVYMNHADDGIYRKHSAEDFRLADFEQYRREYVPAVRAEEFLALEDGEVFDLGGISIESIRLPGHTRGSMIFLFREERMLLTGDACNGFTYLFGEESLSVEEYERSLIEAKARVDNRFDQVLVSHGDGRIQRDVLDSAIALCREIQESKTDDLPFEFKGETGVLAMANSGMGTSRLDGKTCNIIYKSSRRENHV